MAMIINPITTAFMTAAEYDSGEFARFPFKYILEENGSIMYHTQLSAGRFVCMEEAKIKGLAVNKTTKPREAILQHLPNGGQRVPEEFFWQIRQFFLDVMGMGPSTYEAQVFVLWNEHTQEYRIMVPKQTVSAAAVRYDIQDQLGEGDHIIMDIHSHNDMGAFFSGTDDRDDAKNCWISGVFGKLSTNLEYRFRFNDGTGHHYELAKGDIFTVPAAQSQETPQAWIDQVEIQTYSSTRYQGYNRQPYQSGNYGGWPNKNRNAVETQDYPGWGDSWDDDTTGLFSEASDLDAFLNGSTFSEDDAYNEFYDTLVDCLSTLDPKESVNVLKEFVKWIDNPAHEAETTDREWDSYSDVTYYYSLFKVTPEMGKAVAQDVMGA